MALTTTEANAVNWVIKHFLGLPTVPEEKVIEGMETLITKAQKTLLAGLRPEQIRPAMEQRKLARDLADSTAYTIACDGKAWVRVTEQLNAEQREALADAALRWEAATVEDRRDELDPRGVRWWRVTQ